MGTSEGPRTSYITSSGLPDYYEVLGVSWGVRLSQRVRPEP